MSNNSPCHNCEDREVGCHGECPRYQQYDKANKELKERIKIENELFEYKKIANDKRLHSLSREARRRNRGL